MFTVSIDESYNELCHNIIRDGVWCETRNGNVQSLFGEQIRHYMQDGFPLPSGKKMAFKQINARLIAAAPKMLEIFEELEIHLNHQYDALYPDTQEFLNRIEAVIRRIES